jgi:uncharacterized membrane protein YgcG
MMLRTILWTSAALTLATAGPVIAQTSTDDTYTAMPPPAGYDDVIPDDGYVDIPGTNHRDSADSPSSANNGGSSAGTSSGTSGGSTGTGSTGGGAASARR